MGKKHVDEFTGVYIKYMAILPHISACQRAPIVAEAVKGPVNRMAVPVEVNQLLRFVIIDLPKAP